MNSPLEFAVRLENTLARLDDLRSDVMAYEWSTKEAERLSWYGLGRRLSHLEHIVRRIYEIFPVGQTIVPRRVLRDGDAFLQSHVINVFGTLDNLANLWHYECRPKSKKNKGFSHIDIGLIPDDKGQRKEFITTFSQSVQTRLDQAVPWFDYLKSYRHSLAHRVPLYIPNRLDETFEPIMVYSVNPQENSPVYFHVQLQYDLEQIIHIGRSIMIDIQNLSVTGAQ
jgi:hypothetical protein